MDVFARLLQQMGERGRMNELALARLLESFVPERIGVGTGVLFDSQDRRGPQTDVVLFDRANQPAVMAQTTQVLFPVEVVPGCVEVKTHLLRISEAIALQWRHLQLDGSTPHLKVRRALVKGTMGAPKSRHSRRDVPLDPDLALALREQRRDSEWPGDDDLVFPSGNGSPLMPSNLRRCVLKPTAQEAGVPWVGFHTFRHTCASLLFAQGRNAVQVQRWLGHHSAAFTLSVYVHLLDGDLGEPLSLTVAPASAEGTTARELELAA